MPVLRVGDAQEREDVGRLPEMAMRVVRGVEDRLVRRQRRQARGVPGMAPLEGEAGGHARAGAHVQEARRRLLADLAHAGADGRGPPGLFVDGIWLARDLVVLIAYDGGHVASWYMAESDVFSQVVLSRMCIGN